jgi:hypothetical protein
MQRSSSFKKPADYTNITSLSVLTKLRTTVVIGILVLSGAGCTMGKSWNESLTEGRQAIKSGDNAKAETSLQAAIDATKAKFGENDGRTATCMTELAEMYMAQQEYRKASKIFKELVPIYNKLEPGSQDALRVEAEYQDVKMKIKKYQLEPDEVDPAGAAKTDATKGDAAKTDDAKTDAGKGDAAKTDGAKTDSKTDVTSNKKSDSKSKKSKTDASDSKNSPTK